jgi:dipeptidyl-peptidase-4
MADTPVQSSLPIEAIAVFPAPGMAIPTAFTFSPDDQQVCYLYGPPGDPVQRLYALDVAGGEARVLVAPPGAGTQESNLSPEEELRRQRERMLAVGITRYAVNDATGRILIPSQGNLYVQDGPNAPLRLILDCTGKPPAQDAAFAPDSAQIAYVQAGEIWRVPAADGAPRQLTHGAQEGVTHGLAEYIAQEELGRRAGFWWSPDGAHIAFTEVDERHIPLYRIMHQGKAATGASAQEDHRYPFAGAANALVRLGVIPSAGGDPVWMETDLGAEGYIARVFWWPDGDLGAELLDRPQTRLDLVRFDIRTGRRTGILVEESKRWITMRTRHRFVLRDSSFVWASERSGFNHLYLYDQRGALVRQLTKGHWVVDDIASVDEDRRIAYFTGNRETLTEQHLYAVPLDGGSIRRITSRAGMHSATLDHACRTFIDQYSSLDQPPVITLRRLDDDGLVRRIFMPNDPRIRRFRLKPPQIVTLTNRAGTELYGAIYRPDPDRFGPGPYPTIVEVYGGPGPQMVQNSWVLTTALRTQYLRELGYLIFRLDNRGSARRGLAFEGALALRMGTVEVADQVDGVRWLVEQRLADPQRVGIIGWSYGGYMALMCLAKAPETFRVAVAGAPVTSWDGYDTAYTERYMGTPQENPRGYARGSALNVAKDIRGKLLIIHGMLDENVHFRHTARLINALIAARIPYDLLIFPDERHMPRRQADRVYLHERTIAFFREHL